MTPSTGTHRSTSSPGELPQLVSDLVAAVAANDAAAVAALFTEDALYWTCVPAEPLRGRAAIFEMFDRINDTWSGAEFEIVNWAVAGPTIWLERIDRFYRDGRECPIECTGVVHVDPSSGLIREVRDYCDMQTWKTRFAAVSADLG